MGKGWEKGVIFINGFNIGPTLTYYLPGPLLKYGSNEVSMALILYSVDAA